MFWQYIGNVLAMYWECFGNVLAMLWPCFGNVLAMYWHFFGHVLAMCWLCFGNELAIFWQCFGHHPDMIWASSTHVWDTVCDNFSYFFTKNSFFQKSKNEIFEKKLKIKQKADTQRRIPTRGGPGAASLRELNSWGVCDPTHKQQMAVGNLFASKQINVLH